MSRVERCFKLSGSEGKLVLGAYLVAGYPNYQGSYEAIMAAIDSGADMIELGIPYSDPVADGKVLQEASRRALEGGTTTKDVLRLAGEVRKASEVPIMIMTYYNPVLQYGLDRFCGECVAKELDGLLVPDLPVEESKELLGLARDHELNLIYFLSLNSPDERIRLTAEVANGFLYLFSVLGVTGERKTFGARLPHSIERIRGMIKCPICVGFGVSGPEQVSALKKLGVEGFVVGSGIVRRLDDGLGSMKTFVATLKGAC